MKLIGDFEAEKAERNSEEDLTTIDADRN